MRPTRRTNGKRQSPAEAVIEIFDGAGTLARLLAQHGLRKYDRSTIYRWPMPREKGGSDGRVPGHARQQLLELARILGKTEVTSDLLDYGRERRA